MFTVNANEKGTGSSSLGLSWDQGHALLLVMKTTSTVFLFTIHFVFPYGFILTKKGPITSVCTPKFYDTVTCVTHLKEISSLTDMYKDDSPDGFVKLIVTIAHLHNIKIILQFKNTKVHWVGHTNTYGHNTARAAWIYIYSVYFRCSWTVILF